jgi:hypothetical protein
MPVALRKAGSLDCEGNQAEEGSTNFSKKNMGDQAGKFVLWAARRSYRYSELNVR